ncbi:type II toxin-antitoxin system YafQ family toxin [Marinicella sp. W31]|uniref:type II toxin-antitoxin system YafQ family toxin n=1 Tax=Marinicella sp. W31 TaxID=3023713 RepID=UPI00375662DF
MKRKLTTTQQFEADLERAWRNAERNVILLMDVIDQLQTQPMDSIPEKNYPNLTLIDHQIYHSYYCYVENDFILLFTLPDEGETLLLLRCGSFNELFEYEV